jgi:hypothetical protein
VENLSASIRVHPRLNQLFQPPILTQLFDQFLDLLRLAFVREQHRVVGLDQNGIAQADHGDGRAGLCFGAIMPQPTTKINFFSQLRKLLIDF